MFRKELFPYFDRSPYFTKPALITLADKFGIGKNSLNIQIHRAITKKEIINLKRSVYVNRTFFEENKRKLGYSFFISNLLCSPSYITRESALQYHGLLSEAILNVVTANTIGTPRKFKNNLGIFEYKKIKNDFFTDFEIVSRDFDFVMAKPYKAIFDYLYTRINLKNFEIKNLGSILDSFRINYEEVSKKDLRKLKDLILKVKNG